MDLRGNFYGLGPGISSGVQTCMGRGEPEGLEGTGITIQLGV